jgi:uncharacterized protein YdeI (YjbR/CyaY-like superfamily)
MAMKKYKTVDHFVDSLEQWQPEITRLREILQATVLEETLKWSFPCYTHQGKNVVGIGGWKSYFGLWFFQGVLMPDPENVLINAQEGKTKGLRQWRMTDKKDIKARSIKSYVKHAIAVVESGQEIKPERNKTFKLHPLLQSALAKNKKAAASYEKLTLGRQREYADYINEAKRDETKIRRLAKIIPMIIEGGGLNDKYKNC